MAETRTFTAEFALVRDAKAFVDHITGWASILPGTLKQTSKVVTWQAAPENFGEYLSDMMETVGYFGTAPAGRKARLNGLLAPTSY